MERHMRLFLSMLYFMASAASTIDVSSSNNVIFGLKGIFCFHWEWEPFNANCSLFYVKEMRLSNRDIKLERNKSPYWDCENERSRNVDLNNNLSLIVNGTCDNRTLYSLSTTVQPIPGDQRTSVTNLQCVWLYPEKVKCTWQPGPNTPAKINYWALYWIEDKNSKSKPLGKPKNFSDLIETGRTCEIFKNTNGCQFLLNKRVDDYAHLAIVVTDTSRSIKPFVYYTDANQIAKIKPPIITEATRIDNSIYVSWNKSQNIADVNFEVLLTSSSSEQRSPVSDKNHTFSNTELDVTYSVKVRVMLPSSVLPANGNYTWSDWSKEQIIEGKDNGKLISIILPLLISAVILIAAILLLVHLEKMKALFYPEIPDPARIFPKDLREWLKNDIRIDYSKPEKEEICPVYLLESPRATKCV